MKTSKLGLAVLGASLIAEGALAQGVLEEVVVSARKRVENLQEVPVAVTAFSADQMDRFDVQSAMDLSTRVPNFLAPRNTVTFGAPQFFMRGAGRAENNWNYENAVAIFVDGVYLQSTAGAYIDMLDMESVEVLRGPQGTLYGRNATTGSVSFTSRKPELDATRFMADATTGSNSRQDIKLTYSAPLIDNELGFKVDLFRTANDGYVTRVDGTGAKLDDNYGEQEHMGGRLGFLWEATDTSSYQLILEATEQDSGTNLITPILPTDPSQFLSKRGTANFQPLFGENLGAAEPLTGNGGTEFEGFNATLIANWELPFGSLKSITGWREYDEEYKSQLGSFPFPLQVAPGLNIWTHVDSDNDFEQFTQEFQFSGSWGDNLSYVAGLYYFYNDWSQFQYVGALIPIEVSPVCCFPGQTENFGGAWNDTSQETTSYAVYFDADYQLSDSLNLFFGARQTWDEKEVDYLSYFEDRSTVIPGFPVNPDESWDEFTPRLGLEWQATEGIMAYISYSKGFKAGALEGARATDAQFASNWLDPEVVDTFELGVKAEWFDGQLRTNVAVFTSEYKDKVELIDPQTAAVADVDINGLELDFSWLPTENLTFFGNLGLLDAEYKSADADHPIFDGLGIPGNAPGLDAEPVAAPEYTFLVGGNYFLDLGDSGSLLFQLDYNGVDEHYSGLGVANFDSEIVESYELLGANVTYTSASEKWSVALGGDNLTDEEYWSTTMFGFIPGRTYGDETTWYLRFRYDTN
ncbi:MAG: TonB-dependent receptor [Halioglobus sp.]